MTLNRRVQLVDWMCEEGMIQCKPTLSELLTDDYALRLRYSCRLLTCSSSSIP